MAFEAINAETPQVYSKWIKQVGNNRLTSSYWFKEKTFFFLEIFDFIIQHSCYRRRYVNILGRHLFDTILIIPWGSFASKRHQYYRFLFSGHSVENILMTTRKFRQGSDPVNMGAAEPSLCSTHVMVPSFSLIRDTVSPEVWAHTELKRIQLFMNAQSVSYFDQLLIQNTIPHEQNIRKSRNFYTFILKLRSKFKTINQILVGPSHRSDMILWARLVNNIPRAFSWANTQKNVYIKFQLYKMLFVRLGSYWVDFSQMQMQQKSKCGKPNMLRAHNASLSQHSSSYYHNNAKKQLTIIDILITHSEMTINRLE